MSKSIDIVHAWQTRKGGPTVIVIPKLIREELGIASGDKLFVKIDGSSIVYTKRNNSSTYLSNNP
ncbi:MAG TPA: AbrB/MazE/SpoVT family DNA-binding domain-containing protein [Verrucomicrobiae bacterium]|nr:AbrB/MazE/SpoVT family DNA-binding domain-containing protein [Verrucomicrobiae bacterium]